MSYSQNYALKSIGRPRNSFQNHKTTSDIYNKIQNVTTEGSQCYPICMQLICSIYFNNINGEKQPWPLQKLLKRRHT